MDDITALVDAERRALAAELQRLDPARWHTPSLCAGWQVRDVVVHLLMPYEMPAVRFFAAMLRSRFDFDRVAQGWVRRNPVPEARLPERLLATATRRFSAGGPAAELSHLVIHGLDVRHPLGIGWPAGRSAGVVLDSLMAPRAAGFVARGLLDGLSFVATDAEWRRGGGAEVRGPAAALITTVAGRPAGAAALTGEGAAILRDRLAQAASPTAR
jgi:uncharacterized protein (TIGR03083 family)